MSTNLEELHTLLCEDFKSLLNRDEPMTAADRKLLLEFLRDNNITVVGMNNKNITNLVERLPFAENEGLAINQ